MFHRKRFEVEYADVFDKYRYGSTIWSPLAGGLLTGRYLSETKEEGGRMTIMPASFKEITHFSEYFGPDKIENTRKMFKEFEEIAKEFGGTIPQLALAWALRSKDVSSAICGHSKVSQVEDNCKAAEMLKKFTPEIDAKIEKLLNNRPDPGMDFKTFGKSPYRR